MTSLLNLLESYGALLVAPLGCAAAQLLYLRAGRRYDLGAIQYVALGAFFAAAWSNADMGSQLRALIWSLGIPALLATALRLVALARALPSIFTLVSLAQFWSTPPLIAVALLDLGGLAGIQVGRLVRPMWALLGVAIVSGALMWVARRGRWPSRLEAATESPEMYGVLLGSRMRLALLLESFAIFQYLIAGIFLRLVSDDLSVERFSTEAVWIVLGVALAPAATPFNTLAAPAAVTALRYMVSAAVPAALNGVLSQGALAASLGFVAWHSARFSRVSRS